MTGEESLDIARASIYFILKIVSPLLITALVVGVVVGLLQALTHIQELALVFIPKILAIFIVLFLFFPLYGALFKSFSEMIFSRIIHIR